MFTHIFDQLFQISQHHEHGFVYTLFDERNYFIVLVKRTKIQNEKK